jgi:hypothetical protein
MKDDYTPKIINIVLFAYQMESLATLENTQMIIPMVVGVVTFLA